MNILILTGKFGMGHWSAAQSLRQQLMHSFPDATVEVEDFLTWCMPNLAETMYKGFNLVVTHGSPLFNAYYKLAALNHPDARPPFEGLLLDKLAELLYQHRPDAVIATHPLCAQLVSRLKGQTGVKVQTGLKIQGGAKAQTEQKREYGLDLPLITCVTDVSSHPEWINQNTDCYMVPSKEIRQELIKKGVDPALICVTGIPVREEFRCLSREENEQAESHPEQPRDEGDSGESVHYPEQLRDEEDMAESARRPQLPRNEGDGAQAGCCPGQPCNGKGKRRELLIMGGGLGMLPKSLDFYDTLNRIPNTHTTIITGYNQKLYDRLHGRWENIQVVGYTNQVWEYMSRADLIVTKPGGITLFETIFAQVPILTWPPTLQQERGNARWLAEEGIGWVADKKNCAWEIQEILMDSQRLSNAQLHMRQLREEMKVESLNGLMEIIAQDRGVAV